MRYEVLRCTSPLGAGTFADGADRGSSRFLVEFPLECYELYAHTPSFQCNNVLGS
jgi:hypothetical protein